MKYREALVTVAFLTATPSFAQTFDFETFPSTGSTGAYTSLVYTVDGLTMTLTRDGIPFDLNGGAAPGTPAFGQISLSPFLSERDPSSFMADFSSPLSFISLDIGDYGFDSDIVSLSIFSGPGGTGSMLSSTSLIYGPSSFPTFGTLSLTSATPFSSAVFIGGSTAFPNSVYYDNITVRTAAVGAAVPESSTWAMMLLGFGFVGGAMRFSKRRQKLTASYA